VNVEPVKLEGRITIEVVHADGSRETREMLNTTTKAGFAAVAGLINGVVTNFFEHIAVGTGTTPATSDDTALETEVAASGLSRAAGSTSRVTTTVANDTAQIVVAYTVSGSVAVTETGLFDSAAAGVMLARRVFAAVNVVSGDTLTVTWKVQVA
jgi:hypothetical protein